MAERTESQIEIAADPAAIMAVIADIADYPRWCPGVRSASVQDLYPDARPRDVQMVFESGPIQDTHTYRYDTWGDLEVDWHLTAGRTVTALEGRYSCDPAADGLTVVHYRLAMELAVPIIGALKHRAERVIVRTALKGLKERVESGP
jgi:ribosome-associated toxin RatA of RatAB toxin-antitoxin module